MKTFKSFSLKVLFAVAVLLISGLGMNDSNTVQARPPHGNPAWAPPYYTGVEYYYFPDIEVYYDLRNEVFVYFRNGQWIFTATLPGIYAGFDLYNGFVVALNVHNKAPWLRHQYYVRHYPRYYYEKVYTPNNRRHIRGYNEWSRRPYFSKEGARRSGWKDVYKGEQKRQKEFEKARKQEWKEHKKQNRQNGFDDNRNKHDRK